MNETDDKSDQDEMMVVRVGADLAGTRLDKFLALSAPEFSRTRLKTLIEDGFVMAGDTVLDDPSQKVSAGMVILFAEPEAVDADPIPENLPLDIIYQDKDLLVINKDADMVVHPAAGHHTGTLVNALLYHCGDTLSGIGGVKRPGIVHRLDRGTSGLMMVAKNDRTHVALQAQLSDRTLGRIYQAMTFGIPVPHAGTIDKPIGRNPRHRLKMMIAGREAREAITHYTVRERYGKSVALVECRLSTGRTHQIRVHMASVGCPLIGDVLYGPQDTAVRAVMKRDEFERGAIDAATSFARQALHAGEIHFIHPTTGDEMHFTAPLPPDFQALVDAFTP